MGNWLNQLLGKCCIYCYSGSDYVCKTCKGIFFEHYGDSFETEEGTKVHPVYRYNTAIEHALLEGKFEGYYQILTYLGEVAGKDVKQTPYLESLLRESTLVPVPISAKRMRERGFNQVEKLILGLERGLKTSLNVNSLLQRGKHTSSQVGHNRQQRLKSLKDAFVLSNKVQSIPREIVLVDDVYTTGATISECSSVLKSAGAQKIEVLVFASP